MTRHTVRAELEVKFRFPGMPDDEHEVAYPTLDIEFTFTPGAKSTFDDPGYSAELELVKATLIDGDGLDLSDDEIRDRAQDWLDTGGFDLACIAAAEDRRPDPDDARDRAIDDQMMGR